MNFKLSYWKILAIFFFAISIFEFFWFKTNIQKYILLSDWKTVTSDRAKISFSYPKKWPLSFEPEEELKVDQQSYDSNNPGNFYRIEFIDFSEKWNRSAGDNRYGSIIVWRQKNINNLDDYVKLIDTNQVKEPKSKIVYSVMGDNVAITEYSQDKFARLDKLNLDYIIVRNGLIYRFQGSSKDPKTFQKIVSSVKFLD